MAHSLAVLGINSAHDASACLMLDDKLTVAISEERLSRIKHYGGFPHKAVEYCLRVGGLPSLDSVDCIVLNEHTWTDFTLDLRNNGFQGELITNPSHHLLHAYYAWIASGFTDMAILVVDGSGYSYGEYDRRKSPKLGVPPPYSEMEEAESLYVVKDGNLEVVSKRWALWETNTPYYRFGSLGHMFSMASQYIFGHWQHAGKTMGLAPYGDPTSFSEPFLELSVSSMEIHTEWVTRLPQRSPEPAHLDRVCRDLAAKVQTELERAMLHLCDHLHRETRQDRLCISGGVGLNSVANGLILRESQFSELFVTPAAGDSGIAIGGALYGYHRLTDRTPNWRYDNDYHGREYSDTEISEEIDQRKRRLIQQTVDDSAAWAAQDIANGKVVGWFEGGSEFGPRALGHRSILCDPRDKGMRDRLNEIVKFREPFRPYAASVLSAHAPEYFDNAADDPFMLIVAQVQEARQETIPSVCHVDGTCRIQSVHPDHPGRFRNLIEHFFDITGVPLVLNTSFNIRGEPIVETPGDAMDCFLGCNIDVLYVENHRITKASVTAAVDPAELIPRLNNSLSLDTVIQSRHGAALPPQHHVQTRTGHRVPISQDEILLLQAIDGNKTITEIGREVSGTVSVDAITVFADFQLRGFVSFEFGETARRDL